MNKIILIGCPGSGKSTVARKLGERLNIPVHHLDSIMWKENYQPVPYQVFLDTQEEIFKTNSWVIDGNFTKSIPRRIQEADTVVFFNVNRGVCLWRLVKRYFQYLGKTRPDMGGGNKDRLGWKLIRFVLTYPTEQIEQMLTNIKDDTKLVIVRNNSDLQKFLNSI